VWPDGLPLTGAVLRTARATRDDDTPSPAANGAAFGAAALATEPLHTSHAGADGAYGSNARRERPPAMRCIVEDLGTTQSARPERDDVGSRSTVKQRCASGATAWFAAADPRAKTLIRLAIVCAAMSLTSR
jgi:hypothetical protein